MTRRLTDAEFLEALDDLVIESILAMTPEELREEILAEGGDPDAMAEEARQAGQAGLRAIRECEAARATETTPAGTGLPAVWSAW